MTQISAGPSTHLAIARFGTRLGAYVIDWLILSVLTFGVLMLGIGTPQSVVTVLSTALSVAWPVIWLRACSATPGKLMTGLRVQPASAPGRLTWSQILGRVVVTTIAPAIVVWLVLETTDSTENAFVILFMVLASITWTLVDCLSSLGHPRRQAIHDRAAETIVVKEINQKEPWATLPAPVPGGAPSSTAPQGPPAAGR